MKQRGNIYRSTETVHTSAKARLNSVAIRIRIRIRIPDPDYHQNFIICSMARCQPSLKISCKSVRKFLRKVANKQRQAGGFLRPDCDPSSERPQFRMPQFGKPPNFDRRAPPRRRFNQNIPPSVVLLQQCHCRNRHRGKLQNLSPPSVLFESSRIFYNTQETQTQK